MAEPKNKLDINRGEDQGPASEPLTSPSECLTRLLQNEDLADMTIKLQGREKQIKVHRLVLAMWSPVFKAMFFGYMAEEGDSIELPEDDPEAFKWMLDYMYSGCTSIPNVDIALKIYMLSDKYQMDHLKTICSKYFVDSVAAASVPQVMNVATLLDDDGLIKICTQIIDTSPDDLFSSPSIGSLSSKSLKQLLEEEMPISSETVIFQGLLTWGRSQLRERKEDITKENLRLEIEDFLPQIRFLSITPEEFVKKVLPEYILTREELTPIQQKLAGNQEVTLPKICSKTEKARGFLVSKLKSIQIQPGSSWTKQEGKKTYGEGEERLLLSGLKGLTEIYLNKLEYSNKIGDKGELIVRDSYGQEIDKGDFNGKVAVFTNPLKVTPGQEYLVVLKGIQRTVEKQTLPIAANNVISANMENVEKRSYITFYYWQ